MSTLDLDNSTAPFLVRANGTAGTPTHVARCEWAAPVPAGHPGAALARSASICANKRANSTGLA
jgi:hypothetical protein